MAHWSKPDRANTRGAVAAHVLKSIPYRFCRRLDSAGTGLRSLGNSGFCRNAPDARHRLVRARPHHGGSTDFLRQICVEEAETVSLFMNLVRAFFALILLVAVALPRPLLACSACFG